MRTGGRVASVGALMCAVVLGGAPVAHAEGDILSGTYDVMGPNNKLDTWTITPQCSQVSIGCESDVHSSTIDGQAYYRGGHTWVMTLRGLVPVCPDKSTTKGIMQFVWNAQTLDGQLNVVQQGVCQMTRPGQEQIPITLVKSGG
ncbi:hypothetical protein MANY_48310 [Mycolicibacterium anyangense]|uniref:Secreted protein n=1 Tax=Mycolicibacterium anyangense TaxID=1431246 RepID=A0A6N4WHG7_9MYCO|nr:hypothetical protein [Mycolicibacterium anyangense]BBZ79494.1 hypothetical protein MANY_48310 [Mycolicibacterium anyangense]